LTDGLDCAIVSDVTDLTLPSTPMGRRSTALFRQAPAMEHSPRPLCQADATAAFPSAAPAKLLVTLEGPPVLAEAGHRSILDTATPEKGRSASKEDSTQISVKPNLRSPRLALRPFRKKRKREHKVLSQCGSLSIESERVDVEAKQNLHCTKEDQSKPFQHVAHGEDSGQMPQPKRRNKQPQLFVHEFVQVKSCDRRIRERAGQLFVRHGWPLREDGAARKSITSLLGLRNQGKSDGCLPPSTHLGWITKATDGGKKTHGSSGHCEFVQVQGPTSMCLPGIHCVQKSWSRDAVARLYQEVPGFSRNLEALLGCGPVTTQSARCSSAVGLS